MNVSKYPKTYERSNLKKMNNKINISNLSITIFNLKAQKNLKNLIV